VKMLLGVVISGRAVHAVLVRGEAIRWAAAAPHAGVADLSDILARLASEPSVAVSRARIVFARDVVQLRSLDPAPPLRGAALRRYVALEAGRLFRKNGAPLVTDGVRVEPTRGAPLLWAGAIAEPLVEATVAGCAQAGLRIEALGPAADVLPYALATTPPPGDLSFPNDGTTEVLSWSTAGVWRSRQVPGDWPQDLAWHATLAELGDGAPSLAAAFAATQALPRLDFSPPSLSLARQRRAARRRRRAVIAGVALWLLAGGLLSARLARADAAAKAALRADHAVADSVLALRRNLDKAAATLATIADAARNRSRCVALLAALTPALGDSVYLITLRVETDGTVRLVGYAPAATRVLADLESTPQLGNARLEGPVTREAGPGGGTMDRFSIMASEVSREGTSVTRTPRDTAP